MGRWIRAVLSGSLLWPALGVEAQILDQPFTAMGGRPTGLWDARNEPVQVYIPPLILQQVSGLSFQGTADGSLTLSEDGAYQADYVVKVDFSLSFFGIPLALSFSDTSQSSGTYRIDEARLIFEPAEIPADTLGFTVSGDVIKLIQHIPLSDFPALAGGEDSLQIVLGLSRRGSNPGERTADFNDDGRIDFNDFLLFAAQFGRHASEPDFDSRFDLNVDGAVDFLDFLAFAVQFQS